MGRPRKRARPSDPRSDEALVDAARRGDAAAVAALVARYEAPVRAFGARLCKDTEATREVLQETLFAAARALPSYRGEAAIATWLFVIARHACAKLKHKRAREAATSLEELAEHDAEHDQPTASSCEPADTRGPPDEVAIDHEMLAALSDAFAELPPPLREILVLRVIQGLSAPQAAAALGISVQAAKSRLHRAREAIRDRLSPLFRGAPAHWS